MMNSVIGWLKRCVENSRREGKEVRAWEKANYPRLHLIERCTWRGMLIGGVSVLASIVSMGMGVVGCVGVEIVWFVMILTAIATGGNLIASGIMMVQKRRSEEA